MVVSRVAAEANLYLAISLPATAVEAKLLCMAAEFRCRYTFQREHWTSFCLYFVFSELRVTPLEQPHEQPHDVACFLTAAGWIKMGGLQRSRRVFGMLHNKIIKVACRCIQGEYTPRCKLYMCTSNMYTYSQAMVGKCLYCTAWGCRG